MDSSQDLKRVLAEEVRAAIAETAPAASSAAAGEAGRRDAASAEARSALSRAEEVLTPAVPEGAPLSAVKRFVIRALRFLWRNQSSFNSLSLSASARNPTWPRLIPSTGVPDPWVSSAARRMVPSPPMTTTSSQPRCLAPRRTRTRPRHDADRRGGATRSPASRR